MKKHPLIVISVFIFASLACTITIPQLPSVGQGNLQTFTFSESAPAGAEVVELSIQMGAGKLEIQGGSNSLVEGKVEYNIEGWKPVVRVSDNRIVVKQQSSDITNIPSRNIRNSWDLLLGSKTPIDLRIEAGAYEGTLDLSGVPLAGLSISDGASDASVEFNQPNPEEMRLLEYKTGFSTVKLSGLGNAHFSEMEFSGGAGSYTLDFSGALQRDANVKISGGGSNVKIIVPQGTPSRVSFTQQLANVNTSGKWQVNDGIYSTAGSGPALYILIDIGVGNITLANE